MRMKQRSIPLESNHLRSHPAVFTLSGQMIYLSEISGIAILEKTRCTVYDSAHSQVITHPERIAQFIKCTAQLITHHLATQEPVTGQTSTPNCISHHMPPLPTLYRFMTKAMFMHLELTPLIITVAVHLFIMINLDKRH